MILDEIVAAKRQEVFAASRSISLEKMEESARLALPPLDLMGALGSGSRVKLIAEVKRASPSRGCLAPDLDAASLARDYAAAGAAAISVLTDRPFFQGSLNDLDAVKKAIPFPVLRKDFIIDPYQIYEARSWEADAVLLIVAVLGREQLRDFIELAGSLGMQALVEAHDKVEVEIALEAGADLIGINNRDLRTFVTDPGTALRLRGIIPPGKVVVAESGIKDAKDMVRLENAGINAALVGEALVSSASPRDKAEELARYWVDEYGLEANDFIK